VGRPIGKLVDSLLRAATRNGVRRGLGGEHWAWFVVAGTAYLIRRARRPDDRVERIDLQPGERYLVSVLPTGGRGAASGSPGSAS
jgi:hypothetical protein